jgi:hypothetical protein
VIAHRLSIVRLVSVLIGLVLGAVLLAMTATGAHAQTSTTTDIVFSVSDGESPEGFRVFNPNCPPDIICKPQREAGRITFKVSTNISFCCQPLTVQFRTKNGTAVAPGDYTAKTGTLTFQPGVFDQYVTVWMNINPGGVEPPETFYLELFNPSQPADVSDVGVGTIRDGIEDVY